MTIQDTTKSNLLNIFHIKQISFYNARKYVGLAFLFLFSSSVYAANISGIIYGDGTPLENATVTLYNSSLTVIATNTTPADGTYSFASVTDGSYKINTSPPDGSPYSDSPIEVITVAGGDVTHNIALVNSVLYSYQISGQILDSSGTPFTTAGGFTLFVYQWSDGRFISVHSNKISLNQSTGQYSATVPPGTYFLAGYIRNSLGYGGKTYLFDYISARTTAFNVVEDTTHDIRLGELVTLSGRVTNSNGQGISAVLDTGRSWQGPDVDTIVNQKESNSVDIDNKVSTDADGYYQMLLLDTDDCIASGYYSTESECGYDITVSAGLDYAPTTVNDILVPDNSTYNFQLENSITLSGQILDSNGMPFTTAGGFWVFLYQWSNNRWVVRSYTTITLNQTTGEFSTKVPAGTYYIRGDIRDSLVYEGKTYQFDTIMASTTAFNVTANTTKNIQLGEFTTLTGRVTNSNSEGVSAVLNTGRSWQGPDVDTIVNKKESNYISIDNKVSTDADGYYQMLLLDTDECIASGYYSTDSECGYDITVSAGLDYAPTTVNDILVPDNATYNFQLQSSITLSGQILDSNGMPFTTAGGFWVFLYHWSNNRWVVRSYTTITLNQTTGEFSTKVPAGTYYIRGDIRDSLVYEGKTYLFDTIMASTTAFDVTTSTTQDIRIGELVTLSGKVTDSNSQGIPSTSLTTGKNWQGPDVDTIVNKKESNYISIDNKVRTDADGYYQMLLLDTDDCIASGYYSTDIECGYDITVLPPSLSGFGQTSIYDVQVATNMSKTIVLSLADSVAPSLISGPYVVQITDTSAVVEWQTDEAGTSVVAIVGGATITDTNMVTQHSIVLTDLTPQTTYTVNVSSTDAADNTSATSPATFTTLATPDTTAPVFVEGPTVSSITQNQFLVSFCADEPVTGTINVSGVDYTLSDLQKCHELTITGRTANTSYTVTASIVDEKLNGPTVSPQKTVTTLPIPDTTAPLIISGPMVIDISDSQATVIWVTDEPATSGVSYNDGTTFYQLSEDTLTTEHTVLLTDLTADTLYNLTVSSTDAVGNGPVLSEEVTFTTLEIPDTTAPLFIGSPLIQNITHKSVVIRWKTDEPASSVVRIGTDGNDLYRVETSGNLRFNHNIAITGLDEDTVYYFKAESSDAMGYTSQSALMSFRTKVQGHQGIPHILSGPTVDHICHRSMTVTWRTDVNSDSRLVCVGDGATREANNAKRTKKHRLTLSGLKKSTDYSCTVYSTDIHGYTVSAAVGNASQSYTKLLSSPVSSPFRKAGQKLATLITTPSIEDVTAPAFVIQPQIQGYGNIALLSWQTDELATAFIQYRKTGDLNWLQTVSLNQDKSQEFILSELDDSTNYEVQVTISDVLGNSRLSSRVTFNSNTSANLAAPSLTQQPSVSNVTDNSVVVSWSTANYSYGQVNFGTSSASLLDKESNLEPGTSDSVSLVGLIPGTVYYLKVGAFNITGSKVESILINFATSGGNITDTDGDGVLDIIDAFPLDPNESVDTDSDGIGNNTDTDDDGDLVLDIDDAFPLNPDESADTDSDGVGNNADTDDDADGIVDTDDAAPLDNTVGDDQAPTIGAFSALTIEATAEATALELGAPAVTDNNLYAASISSDYDGPLPLGDHEITWTATDFAGNTSTAVQLVSIVDTTAPVFPELEALSINASGYLTDISADINVTAIDIVDGELNAEILIAPLYQSGLHQVSLTVVDNSGNQSSADLTVNINPLVYTGLDKPVEAGATIAVPVFLSGIAPAYPVVINYDISGAAASDISGEMTIETGTTGSLALTIDAGAQTDMVATVTLTAGISTHIGVDNSVDYSVVTTNYTPSLSIVTTQAGTPVNIIEPAAGLVTVTAIITDINQSDSHSVDWTVDAAAFLDASQDSSITTFEFEPSALANGTYGINVVVTENNTTEANAIVMNVDLIVDGDLPVLSDAVDSDGDGLSDASEGYSDSDNDGIADYLDDTSNPGLLPSGEGTYLQTMNGLSMKVGNTVRSAHSGSVNGSALTQAELANYGGNNGGSTDNAADRHYSFISPIYNFVISGLVDAGDSIPVILSLGIGDFIPEGAVYRKYSSENGWYDFVVDNNNTISSAKKDENSNCPVPLSTSYIDGLNAGDDCIRLLLKDGGANDVDGLTNGTIEDPGVLAVFMNQSPVASIEAHNENFNEGDSVSLSSTSYDPDEDNMTIQWEQLSGPTIAISDPAATTISFTAPEVTADQIVEITITVSDGYEQNSITTSFTINNVVAPQPPQQNSGGGSTNILLLLMLVILNGYRLLVYSDHRG